MFCYVAIKVDDNDNEKNVMLCELNFNIKYKNTAIVFLLEKREIANANCKKVVHKSCKYNYWLCGGFPVFSVKKDTTVQSPFSLR